MSPRPARVELRPVQVRGEVPASLWQQVGHADAPVPQWATSLLRPSTEHAVLARWDPSAGEFEWRSEDRLIHRSSRGGVKSSQLTKSGQPRINAARNVVRFDERLSHGVVFEVLVSIGADMQDELAALPAACRTIVAAAVDGEAESLTQLDDRALANLPAMILRRWNNRIEILGADPEREWERDEIRYAVITGELGRGQGGTLRVRAITQPWLRDIVVKLLRVRVTHANSQSLSLWCLCATRLSRILATRSDGGLQPSRLTASTMDSVVAALRADDEITNFTVGQTLEVISALLSQARALGLTDRLALPPSFVVRPHHYPRERVRVREDKGFPDATFRFLMGADDVLGARVLDLARTIPGKDFLGNMFVTGLQLSANFGRRPEELCALSATRVRVADTGAAELLYDNFKSGRDYVWLPIDARAAGIVGAWVARLREEYPDTPLGDLALMPRPQANPRGVRPITADSLGSWFRAWTTLLEQAIMLAHLHQATGLPIEELTALRVGDRAKDVLPDPDGWSAIPTRSWQALVDYRAEVVERLARSKYATGDDADLPLFPDPLGTVGGRPDSLRGPRLTRFEPVSPHRFGGLGEGWLEIASGYACGGIPGTNLGDRRISRDDVQLRMFRHTYLQHLVNLGTDIFLVQELADHRNVQTTIDSYVRVQDEKLREAVDQLARHRLTTFGVPASRAMPLATLPTRGIGTNDCTNPQVLDLGVEGCDRDRMCFGCDYLAADPSYIPDIKSEIYTCNVSLARVAAEDSDLRPHHEAVLRHRRDGWQRLLTVLQEHLADLEPSQRERVDTAAEIVRGFRNRVRMGGPSLGSGAPGGGSPTEGGNSQDRAGGGSP